MAELRFRLAVMRPEMHAIIDHIAADESRQHRPAEHAAEQQADDGERQQHDRRRQQRRHHEAQRIARVDVMHAVDQKLEARPESERQREHRMEQIAMAEIFGQRPGDVADKKAKRDSGGALQRQRIDRQAENDRRVDDHRRQMMHARELVEQVALEQARRGAELLRRLAADVFCFESHDLTPPAARRHPPHAPHVRHSPNACSGNIGDRK